MSAPDWPSLRIRESELETMPWEAVQQLTFQRLQRQVRRVHECSAYYRRHFAQAGFHPEDMRTTDDLARVPFTNKEDERLSQEAAPPFGAHLAVEAADVVRVHASSGTTGRRTFFALTAADVTSWDRIIARAFRTAGMRREDVYGMLGNMAMFVGGVPSLTAASALGATSVPIGVNDGTDRAIELLTELGVTVIGLTPSFALHLGERLAGATEAHRQLRMIMVGGEPGGQIQGIRERISDLWGCVVRDVMGIGEVSGSLWAESDDEAGMHFCGQLDVYVELINPDTGAPIAFQDGAVGELVYSTVSREATPMVRFRSHDIVEVLIGPVPSGRSSPRIRPLGRSDDMLIVRGVNVFPSAIRDVVASFSPETNGHLRILLDRPGPLASPPLAVEVEAEPAGHDGPSGLAARIAAQVRARLAVSTAVTLVPVGSLSRSPVKSSYVVVRDAT
jgi:phenylacetate-CoA ligase